MHGVPGAAAPSSVLEGLQGGLVVSCQPIEGGPMDRDDIVLAMALASQIGGAVAVRIEGVRRVARVAAALHIPVIGIVKRDLANSPVRITPFEDDVAALAEAGARLIAVDATLRPRPEPVEALLQAIHRRGALAMADCATLEEGLAAHRMGFEVVGSTLSGYTQETSCASDAPPDSALVRRLAQAGVWVMAEGRIATPELAAQALGWGAQAVTVGSALTRLEWMVGRHVHALQAAAKEARA